MQSSYYTANRQGIMYLYLFRFFFFQTWRHFFYAYTYKRFIF